VCPTCGKSGAVFFQDQGKRHTTNMTLFYVCVHCREVYRDEDTPEGKARLAAKKAKKDNKDTEATA
jgi:phage terminase large subunit GpA-like protein